jgi:hypothetical protein
MVINVSRSLKGIIIHYNKICYSEMSRILKQYNLFRIKFSLSDLSEIFLVNNKIKIYECYNSI